MSDENLYYRDADGRVVQVTRGGTLICAVISPADTERYRAAVADRMEARVAVVMAWNLVASFDEARTRRGLTPHEQEMRRARIAAAHECEGVLERALAREREAGDRVLKVVLHG